MFWVIRVATGEFLRGGAVAPQVEDVATEALVDVAGVVDVVRERYDVVALTVRPATEAELAAAADAARDRDLDGDRKLRAVARAIWELFPAGTRPPFQDVMARARAIHRS